MSKKKTLTKTQVKDGFKRTLFDPTTGPMKILVTMDEKYFAQRAYECIGNLATGHLPSSLDEEEGKMQLVREALVMLHLAEIKLHLASIPPAPAERPVEKD